MVKPFKDQKLNKYGVFDEVCMTGIYSLCMFLPNPKVDQESTPTGEYDTYIGYAIIGLIGLLVIVNLGKLPIVLTLIPPYFMSANVHSI